MNASRVSDHPFKRSAAKAAPVLSPLLEQGGKKGEKKGSVYSLMLPLSVATGGNRNALARPVNCHYLLTMTRTFSTYRSWAFSPVGFKHTTGRGGKTKREQVGLTEARKTHAHVRGARRL